MSLYSRLKAFIRSFWSVFYSFETKQKKCGARFKNYLFELSMVEKRFLNIYTAQRVLVGLTFHSYTQYMCNWNNKAPIVYCIHCFVCVRLSKLRENTIFYRSSYIFVVVVWSEYFVYKTLSGFDLILCALSIFPYHFVALCFHSQI